jgi:hypothetical protein
MKKLIFKIVAATFLVGALAFNFGFDNADLNNKIASIKMKANISSAVEHINPDCPNGCLPCGDGCYCKAMYPWLLEANH